jgi:hypothetical protein
MALYPNRVPVSPPHRVNRPSGAPGCVERDGARPSLWRIRLPNGHLTEAVEQDRARDAAVSLALESLALTGLTSKPDRPAL